MLHAVRYTPQTADWDCGPACLTTLLNFNGVMLTIDQVKGQLKQATGGGTILPEMIFGARKNGLLCTFLDASITDPATRPDINLLRRNLFSGTPLILFLHPMPGIVRYTGLRRGHYVVVVGYDDPNREFILHSGSTAFDTMSYRTLQLQWSRANFTALIIDKKPSTPAPSP